MLGARDEEEIGGVGNRRERVVLGVVCIGMREGEVGVFLFACVCKGWRWLLR